MARRRCVLVICDGHRRDMVTSVLCASIAGLAAHGRVFAAHRGVFPSVTRVSSASIATGCHPGAHGLHGNTMALFEGDRMVVHDVGPPAFRDHLRAVTGRSLLRPTLAERLKHHGGAWLYSNVSPGAAYFHDPDGHGHVYHRAGSYGPGLAPITGDRALSVAKDGTGDVAMTTRFIDEALAENGPTLATLWLAEPDNTMHAVELGSPAHLAAIASADSCVARVRTRVEAMRAAGDDVLLLVGSDHGQESVTGLIDMEAELVAAGLKDTADSGDVAVASQGTSALVYVAPRARHRTASIGTFLRGRDWAASVAGPEDLSAVGMIPDGHLAFAVSLAKTSGANAHGIQGGSLIAARPDKGERIHVGQHGGLGAWEQAPFLIADGPGFDAGSVCAASTCIVDIAPTILGFLARPATGMDGVGLQGR